MIIFKIWRKGMKDEEEIRIMNFEFRRSNI
jgi:hypothetical protein